MLAMAYHKLLSSADILKTAVHLVEHGDADDSRCEPLLRRLASRRPVCIAIFRTRKRWK